MPLLSCQEIGSELTPVVTQLIEQGRHDEAARIDIERLACLLTVRATILASYKDVGDDEASAGRFIGMVGYSDGSTWPDPNGFSLEALEYLRDRAEATANSILKARYYDLIFEKSNLPGKHLSALAAIDAYLESARRLAESSHSGHQMEMISDMDQATYLAMKIGGRDKVRAVVQSLMTLIGRQILSEAESANAGKHPVGRWALELSRLLMYVRRSRKFGDLVGDADLDRVKNNSRALAERNTQAGHGYVEGQFLEVASLAARLLKETPDEYALELRRGEAIIRQGEESESRPPGGSPHHLIAASFYENAVEHFQQMRERISVTPEQRADLLARENLLKHKIRNMYRLGREETARFEVPIEVPAEELEKMLADFLAPETLSACLTRVVTDGSLLPNLALAAQTAAEIASQNTLMSLLPKRSLQNDMTVAVTKTEQDRRLHEIDQNVLLWIQVNSSIVLTSLFDHLQQRKGLNAQTMVDYVAETGLFDEDNLSLIQTGLQRHFDGDFVSALHILVPQFEDALRTLFERGGKGVIKPRSGQAGWEVETFGAFLNQEFVKSTLPAELRVYIRLVMTEQTGWNLRNRVAHGLIRPQDCNIVTAITVVHLLLLLTLFRLDEAGGETEATTA